MNNFIQSQVALAPILLNANHIDVKTVESTAALRDFIVGFISYYPSWMKALYGIRWGFVRLLGMKQDGMPEASRMKAQDIPMKVGENLSFFQVVEAKENTYWAAKAEESHLAAYLIVLREPLDERLNRYHVVTVVKYKSWAGPVYFNVIRPFHHIVVNSMARAGAQVVTA